MKILITAALAAASSFAQAQATESTWGAQAQATWIWQHKNVFAAAYSGPHSLVPQAEKSYSFSATAALGWRPWVGTELYLDPEVVQGVPMSDLTGLGGLGNGELQKTAGPNPVVYRARSFLRQSWALGDPSETVEEGWNQLAGSQARQRLVLTVGTLSVSDLFDNNRFAHDPRTQFLNWALLTHGAFDFAADARGYSNGAAIEWFAGDWALRGGRFAVPRESNGLPLDGHLGTLHGDQIELEHDHVVAGLAGAVRVLGFRNVERMAGYDEALAAAQGATPELEAVRRRQAKTGWGIALEQDITPQLGGFLRLGRSDGATEPYSFTSIDDAASAGLVWRGGAWQREGDTLGLAIASEGLSAAHRRYLAAGGSDAFLGDGQLRYGREQVFEACYSARVAKALQVSLDAQAITHPAYNRDRGPVRMFALRLHSEL